MFACCLWPPGIRLTYNIHHLICILLTWRPEKEFSLFIIIIQYDGFVTIRLLLNGITGSNV